MLVSALSTKNCAPPTGVMLIGALATVSIPWVTPLSGAVSTRSVPSHRLGSIFHAAWHSCSRSWFDALSKHSGGGIWVCGPPHPDAIAGYTDGDAEATATRP